MAWTPGKVLRVTEVLKTSTRPLRVETDDGMALAKYCGNPQGRDALSSELIAAELLEILDIDAPEYCLMHLDEISLSDHGVNVENGIAFLTRWEESAMTFSGSEALLKKISNPEIITEILVFDTWIKNLDRFVANPDTVSENLDNLLFVPDGRKVRMMVIDHSHSFTDTTFDDGFPDDWWTDREVCGTLPSFDTFVRENVLHKTLDAIAEVSDHQLEEIVDSVPRQWQLSTLARERIVTGLGRRAKDMQEWLPAFLLKQPPLTYELGRRK